MLKKARVYTEHERFHKRPKSNFYREKYMFEVKKSILGGGIQCRLDTAEKKKLANLKTQKCHLSKTKTNKQNNGDKKKNEVSVR